MLYKGQEKNLSSPGFKIRIDNLRDPNSFLTLNNRDPAGCEVVLSKEAGATNFMVNEDRTISLFEKSWKTLHWSDDQLCLKNRGTSEGLLVFDKLRPSYQPIVTLKMTL